MTDAATIPPPPAGYYFDISTFPPDSEWDYDGGYGKALAQAGVGDLESEGAGTIDGPGAIPGMHQTDTIDIVTIISGRSGRSSKRGRRWFRRVTRWSTGVPGTPGAIVRIAVHCCRSAHQCGSLIVDRQAGRCPVSHRTRGTSTGMGGAGGAVAAGRRSGQPTHSATGYDSNSEVTLACRLFQ